MKELRLTLYLVVGLFLGAVSALSFAETVSAGTGYHYGNPLDASPDYQTACTAQANRWYVSTGSIPGYTMEATIIPDNLCRVRRIQTSELPNWWAYSVVYNGIAPTSAYACPVSGGWTLQGNQCFRPDCAEGQVRNESGVCDCPAGKVLEGGTCKTVCPSGYHRHIPDDGQCEKDCSGRQIQKPDGKCGCNQESGMLAVSWSALNEKCVGGCTVSGSAAIGNPLDIAKYMAGAATVQQVTAYGYFQFNGQTCAEPSVKIPANVQFIPKDNTATAADNTTPDPKNTPKNNENPDACGAAGGSFAVVNGVGKCLSSAGNTMDAPKKLSVQEKSTTVTNPDGSKTEQKEQEFRVYDPKTGGFSSEKSTTTIQKDAAGNVIGTTGGTGTASGTGDTGEGQCAKEPNSPLCRQGAVKDKGNYGNGQDAQIEAAKNELRQKFAEVKAQASAMFSGNLTGGAGSLPCYAPITVLGQQLSMCFTKYESSLGVIGGFVMLMAALGAAFIILRR